MNGWQVAWFFVVGIILAVYAVLDGFDLGVGFWHLFARKEGHRRALMNAIGPFWDGNEVWLVTGGGALFAAFPHAYATVFSALYLPLMLVLFGLIFRAVSLEFREQKDTPRWKQAWDVAFSLGSVVPSLLFGVALGNLMVGLPLDERMTFTGTFWSLLNPYALAIGLTGLAMIATQGAIYIMVRTEGELEQRAQGWAKASWMAYLALFLLASGLTLTLQPQLLANFGLLPILWLVPLLALATIGATGWFIRQGRAKAAFLLSSLSIGALMLLVGVSLFPNLVPATNDPGLSLTIVNASSSVLTLKIMLAVAGLGMPLVVVYTLWVYRQFSGKVTEQGYH